MSSKDYAAVKAAKGIIDNLLYNVLYNVSEGVKYPVKYPSKALSDASALEETLLFLTHVERHRRDGERLFVALLSVIDTADVTEDGASLLLWLPKDDVAVSHMAEVRKKLRRGKTFRKDVFLCCENDDGQYWEKVGEFIFY